jgi:hypothetical protein
MAVFEIDILGAPMNRGREQCLINVQLRKSAGRRDSQRLLLCSHCICSGTTGGFYAVAQVIYFVRLAFIVGF